MLFFVPNVGEAMRVEANTGNVGIGTTSPIQKLHVHNTSNSYNQSSIIRMGTETTNNFAAEIGFFRGTSSDADRGLFLNATGSGQSSQQIKLLLNGNVGIGTSSPTRLLQLTAGEPILRFNPTTVAGDYVFHAGDGKLYITPEATSSPTMTFSSGKVGIGTTAPSQTFQIGGGTANVSQKIHGSGTAGIQIFTGGGSGTKIAALEQYFSNEGSLQLFLSGTNKVRLRANDDSFLNGGDVGIGTTSPASLSSNTFNLSLNSTRNDLTSALFLQANGSTKASIYWDTVGLNTQSTSGLKFSAGGSERMRITSTGNVGIGTTDPGTFKLAVNGTFKYGSALEQAGDVSGSEPENAPNFTPDAYLDIKVNGQDYLIPLFTKGS